MEHLENRVFWHTLLLLTINAHVSGLFLLEIRSLTFSGPTWGCSNCCFQNIYFISKLGNLWAKKPNQQTKPLSISVLSLCWFYNFAPVGSLISQHIVLACLFCHPLSFSILSVNPTSFFEVPILLQFLPVWNCICGTLTHCRTGFVPKAVYFTWTTWNQLFWPRTLFFGCRYKRTGSSLGTGSKLA